MSAQSRLSWLPNALTFSRMGLALAVAYSAASGRWVLGFWLLALALGTDFLDGLAAKKLNAATKFGTQLDRLADAAISGGSLIGLALAGLFLWWGVALAGCIAVFLAEERVFPFKTGWLHHRRPVFSIMYLFSVWIFVSLMYISQAYGWHWWYALLTLLTLATTASLKRHRLRAWLRLQP